jgi:hypothetical protein
MGTDIALMVLGAWMMTTAVICERHIGNMSMGVAIILLGNIMFGLVIWIAGATVLISILWPGGQ